MDRKTIDELEKRALESFENRYGYSVERAQLTITKLNELRGLIHAALTDAGQNNTANFIDAEILRATRNFKEK